MRARQYYAEYDNGHDYGNFYYRSYHRNNSKENREDAKREMILTFGKHARHYTITRTFLDNT